MPVAELRMVREGKEKEETVCLEMAMKDREMEKASSLATGTQMVGKVAKRTKRNPDCYPVALF